jgi:small subunit ribosomal protein S4
MSHQFHITAAVHLSVEEFKGFIVTSVSMSVCKLCRRENTKLFLKGDRCFTDKCSVERRPYPPGQHGQARLKFSEFALQLREKQKAKRYYGIIESQFRRYFHEADRKKGETGTNLLSMLETRLDNVIYVLGMAASRREARQLIRHKHFRLNDKPVNIPSQLVHKGDVITVREKSKDMTKILSAVDSAGRRERPAWVEFDSSNFKGVMKDYPTRSDVTVPVEENMIVEFYSR